LCDCRYRSLLLEERRKTIKEKLAKKDRKKEKKRKKLLSQGGAVPVDLEVGCWSGEPSGIDLRFSGRADG
jgi:hypothetical protein